LPRAERPEFVRNAQQLAQGQKVETQAQYEQWPKEKHPHLWNVLKQESFAFDVGPEVLDLLIHLSAPPVEAPPEAKAPPAGPGPGRPLKERADKVAMRPESAERCMPTWVEVPAGSFLMGSQDDNALASDAEKPQFQQPMPDAYRISRYPVTRAEFARFVEAGGYRNKDLWTEAGWKWRGEKNGPVHYGGDFDRPDQPVVGVCWYEAVAYCRWLTSILRAANELGNDEVIRLPSEAEWEKAARGEHGREWPWGDEFDSGKANTGEGGAGHTTPVGQYSPAGDSPYGCADMAGNVWQWCSTKWVENYKGYDKGVKEREDLEGEVPRVLRGGSWSSYQGLARCADRNFSDPYYRNRNVGFRVVLVGAA
jgi:formylglycine-generating enzyme required for sulfatase activity